VVSEGAAGSQYFFTMKKRYFEFPIPVLLLLAFGILITIPAFAQKEANIWCFGSHVGLDFNSGSPVFFAGSAMDQWEGCSSIADPNGNLLFYTDGISVWNKNHALMPNGSGLLGGGSSTQSALIVKQPGNASTYFIFTTAEVGGPAGFNYSTVDITLQGGLGDVVVKNVNLLSLCDERVTAAWYANGTDIWIISTSTNADTLYSFLLTSTGVNSVPVVSYNGVIHGSATYNQIGSIKASQAGDRLGIALNGSPGTFELYDYDNATGVATLVMSSVSADYTFAYGIEFSPNGNIMYGSEYGSGYNIYQFDLLAGSGAAIAASALLIGTSAGYSAALQLAPDGKIYLAKWMEQSLGAITDPDILGLGCNFVDVAVTIPVQVQCNGGLPDFMPGFLQTTPVALFSAPHHICPGTCTNFTNLSQAATSYLWSFPGANPSTSMDVNPVNVCYNTPGNYTVQLIATNSITSDTLTLNNYITVYPSPPQQGIAQTGPTLFANAGAVSYQWFHDGNLIPGATDYFYIATEGGNFNVVATDGNGCEVEAAIFDVVAGIQLAVGNLQLSIYPNPVEDRLVIDAGHLAIKTISIYNLPGEKVLAVSLPTVNYQLPTLDCRQLLKGIYWLEVKSGDKFYRTKFVKQ